MIKPSILWERGPVAWVRSSLAVKLSLAMVGIALAPLLVSGLISYYRTSSALTAQVGDSIAEVVGETADLTTQALVENTRLLQALAGSPGVRAAVAAANERHSGPEATIAEELDRLDQSWRSAPATDPLVRQVLSGDLEVNALNYELRLFQEQFPRNISLLATDRHGALVAATVRPEDYFQGDEGWWRAVWGEGAGSVNISEPQIDPSTGTFVVSIGVPVNDESGTAIGVLRATADVRELLDILSDLDLGRTGRVFIASSSATVLFDPLEASRFGSEAPAWLSRTGLLQAPESRWTRAVDEDGRALLVATSPPTRTSGLAAIDNLGWVTVATMAESEALAPVVAATRIQLAVALVSALLAVGVAVLLAWFLTRQVNLIRNLFDRIGIGELTARAKVLTRDEIGRMAEALNAMLDNTLTLIQTADDRDRIERSIVKLLDEISGVAQGDLTRQAEVSPEITGAIADSFNYMIAELRSIILRAQQASDDVGRSAAEIRRMMESLADGSQKQSAQITGTTSAIEEMAQSIQKVAENAKLSATVAEDSMKNAREGTEAVRSTVTGMTAVRERVQETAKRIKRLGESSQEVGEIVQLIDDIADRTSILALNASIQAASAGEAGRGFAVVAEEIERLAERASDATKRINTLIQTIQAETNEAAVAMGLTTEEVISGSEQAHQAGQALEQIESVSSRLAELIRSISGAAEEQAHGSESLAKAMSEISRVTQSAASGTQQAALSINQLANLAEQLRSSVSRFELPVKEAEAA